MLPKKLYIIVLETKPCLTNSQTLKMIYQVEFFPHPDKQGTPEESRRITSAETSCYS